MPLAHTRSCPLRCARGGRTLFLLLLYCVCPPHTNDSYARTASWTNPPVGGPRPKRNAADAVVAVGRALPCKRARAGRGCSCGVRAAVVGSWVSLLRTAAAAAAAAARRRPPPNGQRPPPAASCLLPLPLCSHRRPCRHYHGRLPPPLPLFFLSPVFLSPASAPTTSLHHLRHRRAVFVAATAAVGNGHPRGKAVHNLWCSTVQNIRASRGYEGDTGLKIE